MSEFCREMFEDVKLFVAPEMPLSELASGGFSKKIVVCAACELDFAQRKDFLAKIFAAAKLDLGKDAFYAEIPGGEPIALMRFAKAKDADFVLVFGLHPAQMGISADLKKYQPTLFLGTTLLFADKLSTLEPDKELKMKLWNALKIMFL